MLRCHMTAEPAEFDTKVRTPGKAWLRKNSGGKKRPVAYWRRCDIELAKAFDDRCAYTAMFLGAPGTVDHFVSIDENRALAYEWSNYRYAAGWVNSKKQKVASREILDPFEVQDDWFELLLPSLQLQVSPHCPAAYRARAERTLEALGLGHHEKILRIRQAWLKQYEKGTLTLEALDRMAPLLARAIRKKGNSDVARGTRGGRRGGGGKK